MKTVNISRAVLVTILMATFVFTSASTFAQEVNNSELPISEEQLSQIKEAMRNRDRETVQQLLEEYDITMRDLRQTRRQHGKHRGASPAMRAAVESEDYAAFVAALPENSPLNEAITAENFNRFVEMHEAKQGGDLETAKEIADELGLKQLRRGHKKPGNKFSKEQHEAVKEAVENGDYSAWLEIVGEDGPMAEKVTAENFSLLQQMHAARQDGDFETAQEIMDELGIEHKGRGKHGFGRGMRGES